ncbi:MAG: DUF63 family protein, partial [Candidatus Aenigmatarchaeota archaeon]
MIQEYFVGPILNGSGYNWVNTSVYAVLLVVAVYLVFLGLRREKIVIDGRFAMAVLPYIALGSILSSLNDTGYFSTHLLKSPMLYIIAFSFSAALL